MMSGFRKLSNEELADLPARWENSWLDQSKYCTSVICAYETDEKTYNKLKNDGVLCQKRNGRFYVA